MDADPLPQAAPAAHPAFRRSVSAFARLGVELRLPTDRAPREAGVPDAHATYRAVIAALHGADAGAAPLLEDASLLDRAQYELGLLAPLLRAAMAGDPPAFVGDGDSAETAFATAPSVRLVRTRWDWDGFLAGPALQPPESDAWWLMHLPPSGPVRVQRLHPLPACLLEACARPLTRGQAASVVAERIAADRAALAEAVHAQMGELHAAGFLRAGAATEADQAVEEMRRLLSAEEAPHAVPRSIAGVLARTVRAARRHAEAAARAGDDPHPPHRLDVSVGTLERMLALARVRAAFSTELDGYWASPDVSARVGIVTPLLEVLGRALGSGAHALPPYVVT